MGFCSGSQWGEHLMRLHAIMISFILGVVKILKGDFSSGRREENSRGFRRGDLQYGRLQGKS